MLVIVILLLLILFGLVLYLRGKDPQVIEIGRIVFGVSLLVFLMGLGTYILILSK